MRKYGLLLVCLALLVPCSRAEDSGKKNPVEKSPIEKNSLDFAKLRDPFQKPDLNQKLELGPLSPLEIYPTDQFKLLGVVTGPEKVRAMLQGPDGKVHFISQSMRIGMRKGIVKKITPESIIVREQVTNVLGKIEMVDVELKLPMQGSL